MKVAIRNIRLEIPNKAGTMFTNQNGNNGTNRELLLAWSQQYFMWVVLSFMALYIIVVACSIPGATFLTLVGGFLFGPWWGTVLVVISATLGAFIVFLAVELALRDWVAKG